MNNKKNIKDCIKLINYLEKKAYFSVVAKIFSSKLESLTDSAKSKKEATLLILSELESILTTARDQVEKVITKRIQSGKIRNANQARKAAAGNLFQQLVAYSLAKNVIIGNITAPVTISLSGKNNALLKEYASIKVGDDIQSPDSDVLIYIDDDSPYPIINLSCKTSCRELAGQTYKWKILSDLAICNCSYKNTCSECPINKYELDYNKERDILIYFVTADLYKEINNPQIKGMFKFFDASYITKIKSENLSVNPFHKIVDQINNLYSS